MQNDWQNRWDDRYRSEEYAYGTEPNAFFARQLSRLPAGSILLPAEGEGRNAVFAARQGWDVFAFDISQEGKNKALRLAEQENVSIKYEVGELDELKIPASSFDAVALIYAHFPPAIKEHYNKTIPQFLRSGGTLIFEAFSKNNLAYRTKDARIGGPQDLDSLFSKEELYAYFGEMEILELAEVEIALNEGLFHNGKGSVLRFVGRKR